MVEGVSRERCWQRSSRQLALLKFSIEAGILLWGNGVSHAMLVARTLTLLRFNQVLLSLGLLLPSHPTPHRRSLSYCTLYTHSLLPSSPYSRSGKILFSS